MEEAASRDEIEGLAFKDLIRLGAERGLVEDPAACFAYREERNVSSHTYDADRAADVYKAALGFVDSAGDLLRRLEARL